MKLKIYVEGGGKRNKDTATRCRNGFKEYCERVAPAGQIDIVACGPRNEAFHRFRTAVGIGNRDFLCALLVDSEGPVQANVTPAAHLERLDRWDFTGLPDGRVFLMVQAMETWFFADRATLAEYYGDGFRPNALRGSERNVEVIAKDDLEPSLVHASRDTKTKGAYKKATHAFDLLALIDPNKVEAASIHAAAFHSFLRSL